MTRLDVGLPTSTPSDVRAAKAGSGSAAGHQARGTTGGSDFGSVLSDLGQRRYGQNDAAETDRNADERPGSGHGGRDRSGAGTVDADETTSLDASGQQTAAAQTTPLVAFPSGFAELLAAQGAGGQTGDTAENGTGAGPSDAELALALLRQGKDGTGADAALEADGGGAGGSGETSKIVRMEIFGRETHFAPVLAPEAASQGTGGTERQNGTGSSDGGAASRPIANRNDLTALLAATDVGRQATAGAQQQTSAAGTTSREDRTGDAGGRRSARGADARLRGTEERTARTAEERAGVSGSDERAASDVDTITAEAGSSDQSDAQGFEPPMTQVAREVLSAARAAGGQGSLASAQSGTGFAAAARLSELSNVSASGDAVRLLNIRLKPDALGDVTIRLRLVGNALDLRVSASKPETAEMLASDSHALKHILREAGYDTDVVSIDVGSAGSALRPQVATAPNPAFNGTSNGNAGSDGGSPRQDGQPQHQGGHGPQDQSTQKEANGNADPTTQGRVAGVVYI
ncbi:hook-length control protein FliK [Pseudoxanthobacter soli DSM 19599]|uniref:Hook-length control protein FliK n=1 Tax=Pseudoxanthobacter soli DSM 19599 TaxID=1123029 RepID=A0A1M7ZEP1_9HYPH|nr:hook-length control protein FliK [Pseudoxanthobacter soli DSM 19599]